MSHSRNIASTLIIISISPLRVQCNILFNALMLEKQLSVTKVACNTIVYGHQISQYHSNLIIWRQVGFQGVQLRSYMGISTLVPKVHKITARGRQMEFCIFCAKSRQNERSYVVCSLNVNKLSHFFFHFFVCEKTHQNERSSALCSLNVNKV